MQLVDTINEMPPDPPIHRREEKKTIKMHWQRWTLCNGNGDGWCEGNPMATMAMAMEGTTVTAMAKAAMVGAIATTMEGVTAT